MDGVGVIMTAADLITPAGYAAAVTPSDTDNLAQITRKIYIGGTGNLAVIMTGDVTNTPVVFSALPVGTVLDIRVKRVMSTDTTATNIVALW